MNKNYCTILIAGIISLSPFNGMFGLETLEKTCVDTNKDCGLRKAVGAYILGNFALFGAIPAVSAGFIKLVGSGTLKNSMTDFKRMNKDMAKLALKTMPVTGAFAFAGSILQKNMADKK